MEVLNVQLVPQFAVRLPRDHNLDWIHLPPLPPPPSEDSGDQKVGKLTPSEPIPEVDDQHQEPPPPFPPGLPPSRQKTCRCAKMSVDLLTGPPECQDSGPEPRPPVSLPEDVPVITTKKRAMLVPYAIIQQQRIGAPPAERVHLHPRLPNADVPRDEGPPQAPHLIDRFDHLGSSQ